MRLVIISIGRLSRIICVIVIFNGRQVASFECHVLMIFESVLFLLSRAINISYYGRFSMI